jgi:hypothetical protein
VDGANIDANCHEVLLAHSLMDGEELRIVAMMAGDGLGQHDK